jgi:hypothetical protein
MAESVMVVLEEENGGILDDGYRVNTQITRNTKKLKDQIEEKIARYEMQDDLDQALYEAKLDIIEKLHDSRKTTLSDFMDPD